MSRSSLVLALSLATNLALAWLVFTPASPAASSRSAAIPLPAVTSIPPSAPTLSTSHPATLRDRLHALGLPADAVQAALRAHLEAPRLARLRELRAITPALPWWHGVTGTRFTPAQERELGALRRAEREELTRLFGPAGTVTAAEAEPYLFLPAERAARLAALERDYTELRAQLSESGPTDPAAVDERKRLLEADRARDLAALLDADELTALDRRRSPTAQFLASRLPYFEGTESEYRALYDLQKAFHEKFPPNASGVLLIMNNDARSVALNQLTTDQEKALGPERYAAWQLTQRADYRTLVDLQQRFALLPATVSAISQLPFAVAAASNRVYDNSSLTSQQRRAELTALATQTRAQLQTTLGTGVAEAYLASPGSQWLGILDRGSAFTFGPGGVERVRSPALPPPTR